MGKVLTQTKKTHFYFLFDFVLPSLLHREKEMKNLDRTFTPLIKGKSAVNVKPDYTIKDISGLLKCLI